MKNEMSGRQSTVVMSVLLSSLAGAGIALLLAPKPGREVRSDLKNLAASAREKVTEKTRDISDKTRDVYEQGKTSAAGAVESAGAAYREKEEYFPEVTAGQGTGSLLAPILAGGIVGAGLALLFAPKSGGDLWDDMKATARNAFDTIGSALEKGKAAYEESARFMEEVPEKAARKLREAA